MITLTIMWVVILKEQKKFVTMSDIARELGVSINTVSRALRGKDDISGVTTRKIEEKATELGFIRNFSASSLRTNKSHIVGVILEDSSNPFFSEVFKGIEEAAEKEDYQLILMNTGEDYKKEKSAIDTLISRRVDGLIISPVEGNYDDLKNLEKGNFPLLIVGRNIEELKRCSQIYNDDFKGGYLAAKHFMQTGKKRCAVMMTDEKDSTSSSRLEGFKTALRESGLAVEKDLKRFIFENKNKNDYFISDTDMSLQNAYRTMNEMLDEGLNFDSVFCFNDMVAFGVLKSLSKRGIKCPEEMGVIGFDDVFFSSLSTPSLTTIRIKKHELGFRAFNILKEIMSGKGRKTVHEKLDVNLIIRNSTQCED
jgi:LacI family transcriptional regulator